MGAWRLTFIERWSVPLFVLFACAGLFVSFGAIALGPLHAGGIGDVERAQRKLEVGMTRDEVRSFLGRPNREEKDEWDYWETTFVGSVLRIHFGPDGRVTSSEWWVQ